MEIFKDRRKPIDKEMDAVIESLSNDSPSTETYTTAVNNLKTLQEVKSAQDETKVKMLEALPKVDPNTLIKVGATLMFLVTVLEFEKDGFIKTKAFNLIPKIL